MITKEQLIELAGKLQVMAEAERAKSVSTEGIHSINHSAIAIGLTTSVVEIWKLVNTVNQ